MVDIIKAFIIGIVEGVTEWLPISSTGHIILVDEFLKLGVTKEFSKMFNVVIQLGAILAVVVLYFSKLNPLSHKKTLEIKKQTWALWFKIIAACLPAAVIGILFDDWLDAHFYNFITVALMLIIYGVIFIVIERKKLKSKIDNVYHIDYKTAILIGAFQLLALIPGTSRSGATIIGALILGVSRGAAAEFSFFLAIPVMMGASALKLMKFGFAFTANEISILIVGFVTAFIVSIVSIKLLMAFIKKHNFSGFGWYRIILGVILMGYYFLMVASVAL